MELGRCCVGMHHGTVLGRQTLSSLAFTGGGDGIAKGLSLSLAMFTLSYPLFNTPLKKLFFAPQYGYPRTTISTRDFHQIVSFSGEIVAFQELFYVVTLLAELSATTMTTETRK